MITPIIPTKPLDQHREMAKRIAEQRRRPKRHPADKHEEFVLALAKAKKEA
jgi:hypothetical protein